MTSFGIYPMEIARVCLFIFLMITSQAIARKRKFRDEVPPTEIDENGCECKWTQWMNNDDYNVKIGDDTTYKNIRRLYDFCEEPRDIKCRDKLRWQTPYRLLYLRNTICDVETGLRCTSLPLGKVRRNQKTHYCSDFEITVQCCYCATTTEEPETTAAMTTIPRPAEIFAENPDKTGELFAGERVWLHDAPPLNGTKPEIKSADEIDDDERPPLAVILVVVFGSIALFVFGLVIWMIMTKGFFIPSRKRYPHQEYYQEAPMEIVRTPIEMPDSHSDKHRVAFARTYLGSSSDYMTSSSDDEGYRSRPTYNRKRKKTKSERNRMLHNENNRSDYTSDSLEFPILDSRPPADENSDEGRLRKWFPDEYERSQQQKRQHHNTKSILLNNPFNVNNRKSIPSMDDKS